MHAQSQGKTAMHVLRWSLSTFCFFLAAALSAQTAEVVPNENLVVDGIPKIPMSIAESVDRYNNFRSANFSSWHPTRRDSACAGSGRSRSDPLQLAIETVAPKLLPSFE
jgi:hypothetical protein